MQKNEQSDRGGTGKNACRLGRTPSIRTEKKIRKVELMIFDQWKALVVPGE